MKAVLPTDSTELQKLLVAECVAHAATQALLHQANLERDSAKARLQALLKRYFGRSSEKLDPNQITLAWEAVVAEQTVITPPPPQEPVTRVPRTPSVRRAQRLEDLPVLETITLDLPDAAKLAPYGTALVKIREEITDEVDYQPGKLFRRQIIRPVYASPRHDCPPQIADLPALCNSRWPSGPRPDRPRRALEVRRRAADLPPSPHAGAVGTGIHPSDHGPVGRAGGQFVSPRVRRTEKNRADQRLHHRR